MSDTNPILYAALPVNTSGPDASGYRTGMAIVNKELPLGMDAVIRFDARKSLKFDRFDKNPVLLADHDASVHSILGSVRKRKWTKDGLEVKLDFAPDAQSQAVAEKWDAGHLRGLSIGFLPRPGEVDFAIEDHDDIEYGLFVVTVGVSDLLELSAVAVPRDGDALKASLATGGIDVAAERGRLMAQREPDYSGIKDVLENAFR